MRKLISLLLLCLLIVFTANQVMAMPSYQQGFARSAAESAHPNKWKGLVAAYAPSLGITGGTLFDQTAFKKHGTLFNNVTWVADHIHFATAETDYISVPIDLSNYDRLTVITNFNADAWTGDDILIEYSANYNSESDAFILFRNQTNVIESAMNDGGSTITWKTTTVPSVSTEYTLAATLDRPANDVEVFLDGISDGSISGSSALSGNFGNHTLYVGDRGGLSLGYNGKMKYIFIYNRILSPSEIMEAHVTPLAMFELHQNYYRVPDAPAGERRVFISKK